MRDDGIPLYNEADQAERLDLRRVLQERPRARERRIITSAEWVERVRLKQNTAGFVTLTELRKRAGR